MTSKPTPPSWAELQHDEQVARAARALGIAVPTGPASQSERVFVALVAAVKANGVPASSADIAAASPMPSGTISSAIASLKAAGRVLKVAPGRYLPVTAEAMA